MDKSDLSSNSSEPEAAPFEISQDPISFGEPELDTPTDAPIVAEIPYEDLGELPDSYGTKFVFLVARDPYWLFAYWDFAWSDIPEIRTGAAPRLKVFTEDGSLESDIELNTQAADWYVPVKISATQYYVDLGVVLPDGEWQVIARSGIASTPSDRLADFGESQFATLPFHLGFQKLVDAIKEAMGQGESLTITLARLQKDAALSGAGQPSIWTDEQRGILETLLGKEAVSALLTGSGQIDELFKKFIEEGLNSESGSQLSLAGRLSEILGVPESSLFSGIGASWFGSETARGSETLSGSWQIGETSSWKTGASWETAVGSSWNAAAGASWSAAAGASWDTALGASWQTAIGSSFQVGSSWQTGSVAAWETALSSWGSGIGMGSWETGLSSWSSGSGIGSSWSAQPFGAASRGFHMHVNAEVIFYGGTDPDAKVWIDGKPIELEADGTFRYHFVFPNKDYEIPIVAQSPDGLEFRSAKLSFGRRTEISGDVTATAQPALGEPMGGR